MDYWIDVINQAMIFAIFAVSLNLLLGYAGQVSIAHAAFGAVGGYAAGYLSSRYGTPFLVAALVGVSAAFVLGVLVSLPALRLASEFMILLTLAVQTIVLVLITSIDAFGGLYGLVDIETPAILGRELLRPGDYFVPLLVLTVMVVGFCWWIGESPFGRVLRGIREDQLATQSLGKNVLAYKVWVFGISSGIAGLAGVLLGFYGGVIAPGLYGFDQSMAIIVIVIIGGSGNLWGAVLGAFLVTGFEPFFDRVVQMDAEQAPLAQLVAYGVVLVLALRFRPQGLLPEGVSVLGPVRRMIGRVGPVGRGIGAAPPGGTDAARAAVPARVSSDATPPVAGDARQSASAPPLRVEGVSKSFGGIHAVNDLSFDLQQGQITGLIGPNGAGKTTVFNLLTGAVKPDAGRVLLDGEAITGWSMDEVARRGMTRSFQDVRIYPRLSVLDNVLLAVPDQHGEHIGELLMTPWRLPRDRVRARAAAFEELAFVGLADKATEVAGTLSFGEQKLLALARMLAMRSRVLLLDEPASGVDGRWVEQLVELIKRLRANGLTICIVEHNLEVVEQLSDHVYFMENGAITAGGTMQELTAQERLLEAYFGTA
jgi:branched-chain amino acid transport system permease protein